jgi:hypothetical protein
MGSFTQQTLNEALLYVRRRENLDDWQSLSISRQMSSSGVRPINSYRHTACYLRCKVFENSQSISEKCCISH